MKKLYLLTILFMLGFSFVTGELYAKRQRPMGYQREFRGPPGKEGPHGNMFFGNHKRMKEELGLSDEQINKIGKINLKYEKKLLEIREKLDPMMIKLKRILLDDNPDLDNVEKQLMNISTLKVKIRMLRIKQRLDIEKVLTESQKIKLRNERMRKHRRRPPKMR